MFGSESRFYPLHACPVLAFQVEDIRVAKSELISRGVAFVTDIEGNESEAWTYFCGPDGFLYELGKRTGPSTRCPRINECNGDVTPSTGPGRSLREAGELLAWTCEDGRVGDSRYDFLLVLLAESRRQL